MNLLLDTHILLWAARAEPRLSNQAQALIENPDNTLLFSVASLWEIVIKNGLGRADFYVNGYQELAVAGEHVHALASLPPLHKDPFDRILIAQAIQEGVHLLTADAQIVQYQAFGVDVIDNNTPTTTSTGAHVLHAAGFAEVP